MQDLKACPFCGADAEIHRYYPPFGRRVRTTVRCTSCRANSGMGRAGQGSGNMEQADIKEDDMIFSIDSAMVFCGINECVVDGEPGFSMEPSNPEYKYAMFHEGMGMLLASKDGHEFVAAISVTKGPRTYTALDMRKEGAGVL